MPRGSQVSHDTKVLNVSTETIYAVCIKCVELFSSVY